ncbi:Ig-like domain-containing protein [Fimbriiglobus ruber]|uniref:T1SS secreted agglutinin RTX n=1 Tax=Fimbriiglobus ruber TaxID=1908690 RepID=A0A225DW06_9BACT|nr:Ig-like domain-containing protein [Fimbriiglobus ruber]OWK40495.1 T1SS secreted agglutinin RTX [Fimbriiglobus ruber]
MTVSVLAGAAQDAFGKPNPASAPLTVTYDVTAPAPPTITGLDPATDTGDSSTDGVTNNPAPTIVGTAEIGATVEVFADNGSGPTSLGTVVADGSGDWTLSPATPLGDGTYAVTATATDAAGNTSGPSAGLTLVVDTTAPTPTVTTSATDPTNASPISIAIDFGEDVTGFDETGIDATNGIVSNFVQVDGRTYTFDLTPTADGSVTIGIAAGAAVDLAGNPSSAASFTITSDQTAPAVTGATVDTGATPDGSYAAGTVIDILVAFGEPVTVDTSGGTPTLALNSGGTAEYTGGSGTDTLTFRYTVQAGENVAKLDYASAAALDLNGGVIADAAGNAADLTLAAPGSPGSLAASRDIAIDTTAPGVVSVTANPSSGVLKAGDSVDITVTFSETVDLSPGATLTLTLDTGATVSLTQDPGDAAVFTGTYTVAAGENSPDLDSVSLSVTAGTLRDAAGNDADPTISSAASLATNVAIEIDTTAPVVAVDVTSTGGLNGTADDAGGSGVSLVEVSIQDVNGTGLYWDEGTQDFTSATELFFAVTDTSAGGDWSTWSYSLPPAVTGSFQVNVRATDVAGNQGSDQEAVTVA